MNKHTQGIWDIREFTKGKSKFADISVDAGGGCIFPVAKEVTINNAHLIAAAPELFEALNLAVMMIEQGTISYSDTMDNLRLMKAVLNKARGITEESESKEVGEL